MCTSLVISQHSASVCSTVSGVIPPAALPQKSASATGPSAQPKAKGQKHHPVSPGDQPCLCFSQATAVGFRAVTSSQSPKLCSQCLLSAWLSVPKHRVVPLALHLSAPPGLTVSIL